MFLVKNGLIVITQLVFIFFKITIFTMLSYHSVIDSKLIAFETNYIFVQVLRKKCQNIIIWCLIFSMWIKCENILIYSTAEKCSISQLYPATCNFLHLKSIFDNVWGRKRCFMRETTHSEIQNGFLCILIRQYFIAFIHVIFQKIWQVN